MFDIVTIGSATVDVYVHAKNEIRKHEDHVDVSFHLGEKVLIDKLSFCSGGSGTNTAVAFSRLGLSTGCVCAVGTDSHGHFILEDLKKERVDFLGSVVTGLSGYSVLLAGAHDRTILAYKGVNNELQFNDIRKEVFDTNWLYVSTMLGESLKTVERIVYLAHSQGIKIALNTSYYLAAQGLKKLEKLLACVDILVLNKEEAMLLCKKKDVKDCLEVLGKKTNSTVVITDAKNPVHAWVHGKLYTKKITPITIIDTTGAGDAFAAGFVYGIMKHTGIEKALEYGEREALSVLQHVGAKEGLVYLL